MLSSSSSGVRQAYLDWRTALHQFKFADPFVLDLYTEARHFDNLLLDKNDIIFSQVWPFSFCYRGFLFMMLYF